MKTNKKLSAVFMGCLIIVSGLFFSAKPAKAGGVVDIIAPILAPFLEPITGLIIIDYFTCDINLIWGCDSGGGGNALNPGGWSPAPDPVVVNPPPDPGGGSPAPVLLSCPLPGGGSIASGLSVYAYSATSVPCLGDCATIRESRTCTNGILSGTYLNQSCSPAPCIDNGCAANTCVGQQCDNSYEMVDGTKTPAGLSWSCSSTITASCALATCGKTITTAVKECFQLSANECGNGIVNESLCGAEGCPDVQETCNACPVKSGNWREVAP